MSGGFFKQKKTAVRKLPRRLFWESYKSLCKQSAVHFVGLLTHAFRAVIAAQRLSTAAFPVSQ